MVRGASVGSGGPLPAPVQGEFFTCDILDAVPKDDMASMEHPIFSLATQPDRRVLRYAHAGAEIEITPSVKGLATIHDKDILIFAISQLVAALNRGLPVAPELRLIARDLLSATGRETSGDGYRRLREAFERLSGTRIVTTIRTGGIETTRGFGLIEGWEILRRTRTGRMVSVSIRLSDWLYRAVLARSVLTLSRDYFALRRPLERRLYEIARKHCGSQPGWRIGLVTLRVKTGSASPLRVFRRMVREICAEDHLPDYHVALEEGDMLAVTARGSMAGAGPLLPAGIHDAARAAAPGMDPHFLEAEWRAMWAARGRTRLKSPDAAFLAFCRARVKAAR